MEREPEPGRKRWSVYRTPRSQRTETPEPGVTATPDAPPAAPSVPLSRAPRPTRTSSVGIGFVVLLLVVIAGIVGVVSIVVSSGGEDTATEGFSSEPERKVEVLTEKGIADFIAALEEETGSTKVFRATIYPNYAVVSVPVDGTSQREVGYYYDGRTFEESGKSTSSSPRIDLARIDPGVIPPMVAEARAQVEDPTSWYVTINRDSFNPRGLLFAYSSNEFNEGGYILYDLRGREVRRTDW